MTPPMIETTDSTASQWQSHRVATFAGQHDTHIRTGEDYNTLSLAHIFAMEPGRKEKGHGAAFIPSSYCDYNAREHAIQRQHGRFVALCGDVDSGDHDIEQIQSLVRSIFGDSACLIYSSAHSRPGDRRWRIILPLLQAVSFDDWHDAQEAFFAAMEDGGVKMDHAMSRAAQPVYLPNVPSMHAKSGTALRGDNDEPLYYQRAASELTAPGADIRSGQIADRMMKARRQRADDDQARARIRQEAEQRRAQRADGDGNSLIVDFNASNSLPTMLEICGYQQSPRNEEDWRSPNQTGETYATRIIGDKWVSLSASDAGCGVGEKCKSGCFGDAYDLFVHYKHRGDHKAAFRALHAERRASQPNVIYPPAWVQEAPPYEEMPDWPEWDGYEDGVDDAGSAVASEPTAPNRIVNASPFLWRDTAAIPKRRWLYGKHLLRKFVSLDVAAGGVGKSSLKIGEALAMASGRDIYEKGLPEGALNVWLWNLEDPLDEIERRVHATAQRFKINPVELEGRFFANSGRDQPLVMATEGPDGAMIVRPVVEALVEEMIERKIDVLMVDPFVSSHAVSENDNNAIDVVAREWNMVAERTGAAINLVHHVRKQNGSEATADSARGASSLIGKARSVLVYNRMTEDEAAKLNVPSDERFFYFRVDNDKANLAPPERGDWYRMNNVDLANGDSVGVACSWTPPDAFDGLTARHLYMVQKAVSDGEWRENIQTKDKWVGCAVAAALELNIEEKHARKRIQTLLKTWVHEGALEVVEVEDSRRHAVKFVVVGKWVNL